LESFVYKIKTYLLLLKAEAADATLFKDMTTVWEFNPNVRKDTADLVAAADHPTCWVDFNITFEFASPIHAQASSVFFDEVSKMMLRAFINRCHEVYRK
jgi:coenzyme Q-binding protein COQ10